MVLVLSIGYFLVVEHAHFCQLGVSFPSLASVRTYTVRLTAHKGKNHLRLA